MAWEATLSQSIYQSLIDKIWSITWLNIYWSAMFLFAFAVYILLLIILWFIYKLIKKHYKNNEQKFVLECDQIIAKFANEQYNNKYPENINISLVQTIFESKTKNYFLEKITFENKIKEIETKIWKTIIDQTQLSSFNKYFNRTKWSRLITQIIWRILTIITFWIAKIFL